MLRLPPRLRQHAVQPQFRLVAKNRQADRHAALPGRRLGAIEAGQTVPDRQVEAEIRMRLGRDDRVMHAMHVRRHERRSHDALDARRQAGVGMVEHGGALRMISKATTASAGAPSATTAAILMSVDRTISTG